MTRLPTALILLVAGTASAQVEHQHGAHVHGVAQATLVVADGTLALELTVPGMDLVGFEHAPRDADQQARIDSALAALEASGQWLALEPEGSCVIDTATAHTHGYKTAAAADAGPGQGHQDHAHAAEPASDGHRHADHGHAQGHGHDGGHAHHDGHDHGGEHDHADGHGEFHLELRGTCSGRPGHAVLSLDRLFDGLGTVRVDLIAGDRQDRIELPGGRGRIDLR